MAFTRLRRPPRGKSVKKCRHFTIPNVTRTVILFHGKEIKHSDPKKAVRIALQLVSLALKERISPTNKLRGPALSAEELRLELTRMFLGYLRFGDRMRRPAC